MQRVKYLISFISLIVFVGAVYILTLRGLPGNHYPWDKGADTLDSPPFESSLERGRYAVTTALVKNHTFVIDPFMSYVKPDIAWYDGHYFSAFPPGPAVLAVPLFFFGEKLHLNQVFTYSLSTIFSVLTAIVIIFIGKQIGLSKKAIAISVLIYSFASGAWAYGVTYSAHPISAFLIALSFLITLWIKKDRNNVLPFLFLGLLYGLNFYVDYPNLFILFPLLCYAFFRSCKVQDEANSFTIDISCQAMCIIITLAFSLIPFVIYNKHYFHNPVIFTNTYNLKALEMNGVSFSYDHLSNDLFTKKAYANRFQVDQLPIGMYRLLFSTDRGLFFFFPIYLFLFVGILVQYKQKKISWLILPLIILFDLFVYGSFDDPHGGWAFGPRYLIPILPLATILIGVAFDWIRRNVLMKLIFSLLFLYSAAIAISGTLTTNAVPPIVENVPYTPTNFLLNIHNLFSGQISSYLYISYFSKVISPFNYGLVILGFIFLVTFTIIWFPERRKL
jgi:4-amino-4-deoxy-L-arabinose transferase-like glycosyltransferase